MGYVSYDYLCHPCESLVNLIIDRKDIDTPQLCTGCNNAMERQFPNPMVLKASYPDGKRRFDKIREKQVLKKAKAHANRDGDKDTANKAKQEIKKLEGK